MSISIWFEAAIKLGIPMAVLGWLIFNWLYGAGQLSRDDGHQAIRARITEIKKLHKTSKSKHGNYLYKQWLFFGGGFYGLAVLWTLLVIELQELIGFILNFDLVALFANGVIALIVNVVIAQLGNVITALFWFGYWSDGSGQSVVAWVFMAYGGYLLGIHQARDGETLHSVSDLKKRIKLSELKNRIKPGRKVK